MGYKYIILSWYSPGIVFTGFQQPVSRRLESSSCWDQVAETVEATLETLSDFLETS